MRQAAIDFETSELELIRKSHVELKVREFRESVGLPIDPPADSASAAKKQKN